MTIAANLEIGTGAQTGPGPGSLPAFGQSNPGNGSIAGSGSPLSATPGSDGSGSVAADAQGFQSGWQSLLASLGVGPDGLGQDGLGKAGLEAADFRAAAHDKETGIDGTGAATARKSYAIAPLAKPGMPAGTAVPGAPAQGAGTGSPNSTQVGKSSESSTAAPAAHARKSTKLPPTAAESNAAAGPAQPEIAFSGMPAMGVVPAGPNPAQTQKAEAPRNQSGGPAVSVNREPFESASSNGRTAGLAASRTNPSGTLAANKTLAVENPSQNFSTSGNLARGEVNNESSDSSETASARDDSSLSHASGAQAESIAGLQDSIQSQLQSQKAESVQAGAPGPGLAIWPSNAAFTEQVPSDSTASASGLSGNARASALTASRTVHAAGTRGPDQPKNPLTVDHTGSLTLHGPGPDGPRSDRASSDEPGPNASALSRDLAGAGAGNTAVNLSGSSTGAAPGAGNREPFAALDAGGAPFNWIHAGAQRAEAGFDDPILGWVGVRADASGGNVQASVVPGSAEAAQALSGHLTGLNTYLAEHHAAINPVRLAAPEPHVGGFNMGADAGQSHQQDAGNADSQQPSRANEPRAGYVVDRPELERTPAAGMNAELSGNADRLNLAALTGAAKGSRISVMA